MCGTFFTIEKFNTKKIIKDYKTDNNLTNIDENQEQKFVEYIITNILQPIYLKKLNSEYRKSIFWNIMCIIMDIYILLISLSASVLSYLYKIYSPYQIFTILAGIFTLTVTTGKSFSMYFHNNYNNATKNIATLLKNLNIDNIIDISNTTSSPNIINKSGETTKCNVVFITILSYILNISIIILSLTSSILSFFATNTNNLALVAGILTSIITAIKSFLLSLDINISKTTNSLMKITSDIKYKLINKKNMELV